MVSCQYAEQNRATHNLYGATEALIIRGQSQAKKRVVLFLTVFVVTGFFSESLLSAISVSVIKYWWLVGTW